MGDESKYLELIKEIGGLLERKNSTISMMEYQLKELNQKLKAAESQIEELKKGNTVESVQTGIY